MKDTNGKELQVGQTVKERRSKRKTKIISLDEPFVYISREGDYDDAPVFPEDLTIVDTHDIVIAVSLKCETEDDAKSKIDKWLLSEQASLPKETVSFEVKVAK
jgi:hypothetical protein